MADDTAGLEIIRVSADYFLERDLWLGIMAEQAFGWFVSDKGCYP
jgi:hypothetical protein